MIDLHTHSTVSDGSFTPTALAQLGKASGLEVQALTDHDTIRGVGTFMAATKEVGLIGVPGVELSAEVSEGQLHLVGLNIRWQDETLIAKLDRVLEGRGERNLRIVEAFRSQGIDLTFDEVKRFAGDDLVSRVHFAQALIHRGIVSNLAEAFERFLGKGATCYCERFRYSPKDCIDMIRAAGGRVVVAHPFSMTRDTNKLVTYLEGLKALGAEGMECVYAAYSEEERLQLLRIAYRLGLVPSVASDFHGTPKPTIALGTLPVAPETEHRLREFLHLA